uniref:CCHC-type domain-containing protein n=1 Tax=Caenorhabditis japonica TaxID=281687 RepID=A0A8R1IFN4_CAEJA
MRNKNYDLQTAVSLMGKRHAALEEVCQLAYLAETIEPTSHEHAANLGEIRFEKVSNDFQIDSAEILRTELEKIFQLQHELEFNKHQLQDDARKLAIAQRDAREARQSLRLCQEESMTLNYKVRMLEEQLEQKGKLLREAEDAAVQNNTVQTIAERSPFGRPRHTLSGYQSKPFFGGREVPRRYYEETEKILNKTERYGRYGVDQEFERSPVRLDSAVRHEDTELFSQFLITQSISEPPVFSAAPGKLSISTFAKTSKMKFGTLPQEFQITLLETKCLEGKALKIFKGIPLDEKTTVEATLKAMASRLRVSVEDESPRAKTKWEALRRIDGQSIEDFCLQLDKIARVAFSKTPPEELSSLKTAKLMSALAHNHTIRYMIEVQLMDTEEVRHYDLCRMLATRFEFDVETSVERIERLSRREEFTIRYLLLILLLSEREKVRGCGECYQTGFHDPTCSRAPRSNNVTCFKCGEKGHYSNKCPQSPLVAPIQVPEKLPVVRVEELSQSKAENPVVENVSEKLGTPTVEKGKIGGVEVGIVIDSGATYSLIPKSMWKNIVEINRKDWEKKCAVKAPIFESVFTANNQPMKLIRQVKLETSLKTRTREVIYYVVGVERKTVIIGTDAFKLMGISINIQGVPREVKRTRNIGLLSESEKSAKVLVEGVAEKQGDCLMTPLVESLVLAICKVKLNEKAALRSSDFGKKNDVTDHGWGVELNERVGSPEFKAPIDHACSVEEETDAGMQKFSDLCTQLRQGREEKNQAICEFEKEYQTVFVLDGEDSGRISVAECEIELLKASQSNRQTPCPISLAVMPRAKKRVLKEFSPSVNRKGYSLWSSAGALIEKKKIVLPMKWNYQFPYFFHATINRTSDGNPYVVITGRDPQGPIKMDGEDADGINHSDVKKYKFFTTPKLPRAHRNAKKQARIELVEHNPRLIVSPKELQALVEKEYPQLSLSLILDTIRALKNVSSVAKLRIITTPVVDPEKVPLSEIRHSSKSEYVDLTKLIEVIIKRKPIVFLLFVLFCTKSDSQVFLTGNTLLKRKKRTKGNTK